MKDEEAQRVLIWLGLKSKKIVNGQNMLHSTNECRLKRLLSVPEWQKAHSK